MEECCEITFGPYYYSNIFVLWMYAFYVGLR